MEKEVYIWKESIYKNDFRCNKCKKKLADKGQPIEDALMIAEDFPTKGHHTIFCADCKNTVAVMSVVDTDLKSGLYGDINKFKR